MLPSQTRRRVDAIWDRIWASGVSNPLTAIEYFSTVLLLRRLHDDAEAGGPDAALGAIWSRLAEHVALGDSDGVAALMLKVQTHFCIGASPDIASPATWRDLSTLRQVLQEVKNLDLTDRNHDILGDLFEYMLDHLSTAGHFGQFRTPRHLIQFIVAAVDPKPGEVVVDPASGTAGFLIAAHQHRNGGPGERYVGNEVDATIARVAHTNLLLHGMTGGTIRNEDSLLFKEQDADVILANPPFAGSVVADRVIDFQSGTLKTELLFVELMMNRLRAGGRAGVVVPTGVLTSSATAAVWIRRQLLESNHLRAVVELPGGVFRPYAGVKTGLLFWSNEPAGDKVLLVRIENDGYSLDDKREPIEGSDLSGALRLMRGEDAETHHAWVPTAEIAKNKYNLGPSRYIPHTGKDDWGLSGLSLPVALASTRIALSAIEEELAHLEGLV